MIANEHLTRQLEIIPTKCLGKPVTIIGVGAIGGWATLMLGKMGFCDLNVWDFDIVSIENMNSQFFRFSDIGKPKVDALKYMVEDFANVKINANLGKFESGKLSEIVICAVDSMEARKNIFTHSLDQINVRYFIDARMAAEYLTIFCVDISKKKEIENYKKTLFSDDEAVQERCTAKSTVYTASLAGSLIAKIVKDIATDGKYTRTIQYDIKNNMQLAWNVGSTEATNA